MPLSSRFRGQCFQLFCHNAKTETNTKFARRGVFLGAWTHGIFLLSFLFFASLEGYSQSVSLPEPENRITKKSTASPVSKTRIARNIKS